MSLYLPSEGPESFPHSILHWRESITSQTTVLEEAQKASVIAEFVEHCLETYSKVLTNLTTRQEPQDSIFCSLRSSRDYLVLWADDNGVRDGKLDDILDLSQRLHALTVRLLIKVGEVLFQRLLPRTLDASQQLATNGEAKATKYLEDLKLFENGSSNQNSDSDTDESISDEEAEEETLAQISRSLKVTVGCLLGMGSRLKKRTIKRTEELPSKSIEDTQWHASVPLIERIRNRYPECNVNLATLIGKANWRRMQKRRKRIEENGKSQGLGEFSTLLDPDRDSGAPEKTILPPTLHDSGIGTSVLSARSERAETVVSYNGATGGSIRVPPLPKEACPCIGCGQVLQMSNMVKWKKHLFEDLQPYMCLYDNCEFNCSPFQTKHEWFDHFLADHIHDGAHFECPLCKSHETAGVLSSLKHVSRHLEEIALMALPTGYEHGDDISEHVSQSPPRLDLFPDAHSSWYSDTSLEAFAGTVSFDDPQHPTPDGFQRLHGKPKSQNSEPHASPQFQPPQTPGTYKWEPPINPQHPPYNTQQSNDVPDLSPYTSKDNNRTPLISSLWTPTGEAFLKGTHQCEVPTSEHQSRAQAAATANEQQQVHAQEEQTGLK